MAIGRRVAVAIRSLVNAKDLQLKSLAWNIACTCSYVLQWDNFMEGEGEI